MNTTEVTGIVLCLGLAFAVLSGSGIGATIFGASPGDAGTTRTLEDLGENTDLTENDPTGSAGGIIASVSGGGTLIGLIISVGRTLVEFGAAVTLLPVTLSRLGFPRYFAYPVGAFAQIIAFIGFAQFLTGHEYQ